MREDIEKGVVMVQTVIDKVAEFLVTYSFDVLGALLVLFVGHKVSQWASRWLLRMLERKKFDATLGRFAAGMIKGLILGFAIIVALGKFGITIAPIVAAISALAFGSTFALQGTLSNFGAGISLLIFRPFVVGNTITVVGVSGVVESVTLSCTVLSNEDGEKITIPNKHIVGEVLTNSYENKVVESVVGISYGDDPERAIAAILRALSESADVVKTPAPQVGIQAFGESSVNIGLRYWVPTCRYFNVSYATNLAIWKAIKAVGVTIPFPQREVRMLS